MKKLTEEDLKPKNKDINDPKKSLKKGFAWLGVASIFSQGLDALSMIFILIYISKEDLGLATIAVAFASVIETLCALGIAPALVQDDHLTVNETHSLFWFSVFFGVIFYGVLLIPFLYPISLFYASTAIIPLLYAGCIRNCFASIRQVPTALLRRRLQYSTISINDMIHQVVASCAKISLAILGFGAWSLVLAELIRNIVMLITYTISSRYLPAMHFKLKECKRFIIFGIKNIGAAFLDSINKNFHYFVVGKFFGVSELGVYRIAYELASTPPLALLNVVNSSSFPVFSRIKNNRPKLTSLFSWNISSFAFLAVIPIVFIAFCSEDILLLIKDGIYVEAVSFIPFVLGFAFIKTIVQTFPELYRACGYPEYIFRITALESILTVVFLTFSLSICKYNQIDYLTSSIVMFCVWMTLYLPILCVHKRLSNKFIDINYFSMFKSISGSLLYFLVAAGISVIPWIFRSSLPFQPWIHLSLEVIILLLCIGVYFKWIRKPVKDITGSEPNTDTIADSDTEAKSDTSSPEAVVF